MFEDLEDDEFLDDEFLDDDAPEEEGGNRNFLVIAGVLVGITVIAILCLGGIFYFQGQQQERAALNTQAAQLTATQVEVDLANQQTQVAESWTDTPTATEEPTETPEPTEVVVLPTATEEATENPATATIAALLTQAAMEPTATGGVNVTITALVTPTGLPETGLFDDLGVTGLILLAFFAVVVIFLARRLRSANA